MNSERTRIFIVFIILLVMIAGIIAVRRSRKTEVPRPATEETVQTEQEEKNVTAEKYLMLLSSSKTSYQTDENIEVSVDFKAPGKRIFGSDIVLLYDPVFLSTETTNISSGDFFTSFPRKTVDPKNGIVKISAYQGQDTELNNDGINIVKINFTALKSGETEVGFSFVKGKTNTSTLVEAESSENILENVQNLKINID